MQDSILYSKTL